MCAVAVMIDGGDNSEEGKLAVPCCVFAAEMLMWREVKYHILVCGLVVRYLTLEPRHGILVDWHVLVNICETLQLLCVPQWIVCCV